MAIHNHNRAQEGFSLLEMLLTAFILGIGLLGLAALQVVGIRGMGSSRQRDAAVYLASNVLDRFAAEGRLLQGFRETGITAPTTLIGSATVGNLNDLKFEYEKDKFYSRFSLEGQPVPDAEGVFRVQWGLETPSAGNSDLALTQLDGHEVVVNVGWMEVIKNASGQSVTEERWITLSRFIRH